MSAADSSLVSALKDLKLGSILSILSDVLGIISVLPILLSLPRMFMRAETPREMLRQMMPGIVPTVLLFTAALAVGIISLYFWFRASNEFKRHDERLGIGKIGAILSIIGTCIIIVSLLILFAFLPQMISMIRSAIEMPPGVTDEVVGRQFAMRFLSLIPIVVVTLIGGLIYLVGWILYGVMVMRLGEVQGLNPDFKYAGILMIAGALLSLIGNLAIIGLVLELVSLIMILVYSDMSIKSLTSSQAQATPTS